MARGAPVDGFGRSGHMCAALLLRAVRRSAARHIIVQRIMRLGRR